MTGSVPTKATRALLDKVTRFYLNSRDFNGCGLQSGVDPEIVVNLIEQGLVSLNRGDRHPNPQIKAFPAEPIAAQAAELLERLPGTALELSRLSQHKDWKT